MLETLLLVLTVAFVVVTLLAIGGFFLAQWLFVRTAERVAARIDRHVGGAAAHAMTRMAAYAKASGMDLAEADRRFGRHIDRVAELMDAAVRLPVVGPVGLDVAIGLVPVVGDLAAGAISMALVARSLRYGPPAALVSTMLANVATDVVLGAIPIVGPLFDIWFRANQRNADLMRAFLTADARMVNRPQMPQMRG
jgi:hypothetical protein